MRFRRELANLLIDFDGLVDAHHVGIRIRKLGRRDFPERFVVFPLEHLVARVGLHRRADRLLDDRGALLLYSYVFGLGVFGRADRD